MTGSGGRSLVFLDVTAEVAGHLAVAVRTYRSWGARTGNRVPAELRDLESALARRVRAGHGGSDVDDAVPAGEGDPVPARLVTFAVAARMLAVSESTVKRLVTAGELHPVRIGERPRLRVTEIDAYVDRLAADSTPRPATVREAS